MMVRLNILLALAVLLSAVWLVRSSYESRYLFVELEKAQSQSHELQIDFERLELDKRAQATPLRVERLAREKLHMFNNTPAGTHYVSTAASAASSAAAGLAGGAR
jgi:cell division protein FtsL